MGKERDGKGEKGKGRNVLSSNSFYAQRRLCFLVFQRITTTLAVLSPFHYNDAIQWRIIRLSAALCLLGKLLLFYRFILTMALIYFFLISSAFPTKRKTQAVYSELAGSRMASNLTGGHTQVSSMFFPPLSSCSLSSSRGAWKISSILESREP